MGEQKITQSAKMLGRNGGKATLKKHGKKHFKRISKLAVEIRKRKAIFKCRIGECSINPETDHCFTHNQGHAYCH